MGHPMRLELTLAGLLVKLANHYTTRGARVLLDYSRQLYYLTFYGISNLVDYPMLSLVIYIYIYQSEKYSSVSPN